MHAEVGVLLGGIVLQCQQSDGIRARLYGTIIVYHAANAARAAENALTEHIGDGLGGIGHGS